MSSYDLKEGSADLVFGNPGPSSLITKISNESDPQLKRLEGASFEVDDGIHVYALFPTYPDDAGSWVRGIVLDRSPQQSESGSYEAKTIVTRGMHSQIVSMQVQLDHVTQPAGATLHEFITYLTINGEQSARTLLREGTAFKWKSKNPSINRTSDWLSLYPSKKDLELHSCWSVLTGKPIQFAFLWREEGTTQPET